MGQRVQWQEKEPGELWEARVGQVLRLAVEHKRDHFVADVEMPGGSRIERLSATFADSAAARWAAERRARQMLQESLEALGVDPRITLAFEGIKNAESFATVVERFQGTRIGSEPVQIGMEDGESAAGLIVATREIVDAVRWVPAFTPPSRPEAAAARETRRGLIVWVEQGGHRVIDTEGQMHLIRLAGNLQAGTLGWLMLASNWQFIPDESGTHP